MLYEVITFETIKFGNNPRTPYQVPELRYSFYRFVIAINHFNSELILLENLFEGQNSQLDELEQMVFSRDYEKPAKFEGLNNERTNMTDAEYMQMVTKGKEHCFRGDVFQIVLSRQFSQDFSYNFV